jgi:uncharacterized membrane protein
MGAMMQKKIALAITRFAGSMPFVYAHAIIFAVWMLWIEKNPWPTLTLVVSLEAIFLSTFIMIGQNLQADKDRAVLESAEQISEDDLVVDKSSNDLLRKIAAKIGVQ